MPPARILALALALATGAKPVFADSPAAAGSRLDSSSPGALLTSIYRLYRKGDAGPLPDLMAPPLDARAFDPSLVKLIRRAQADPGGDPIGFFDHDVFCQCQDFRAVRAVVSVGTVEGSTARASVRFTDGGSRGTIRFRLVRGPSGWRIADMAGSDGSRLRADLEAYLKPNGR